MADRVVLDLLEYPVEADDEVETVHDQTDADQTDQCDLVVAEPASDAGGAVDTRDVGRWWSRELVIPGDT